MFRWLSRISAALALGSAVAAAVLYARADRRDPAFLVPDPARDLGTIPLGNHPVAFAVTNPADRPREIVGIGGTCAAGGCLKADFPGRAAVGPGETLIIPCVLTAATPGGPFEITIPLYLDDNGLREQPLTVRWTGAAPEGKPDDKPVPPTP